MRSHEWAGTIPHMGNREDLLAGAKACLIEKGWARTTVRDITAASGGVSMAAIGYHFGSREALLTAAFTEAMDEWGQEIGRALAGQARPGGGPVEQFEAMWSQMIESFNVLRPLWLASVEALVQAEHSPTLRPLMASSQAEGRRGIAAWFTGVEEAAVDEATVRTVGSAGLALLSGTMMQWLVDPDSAPSGADLVAGLRTIAAGLES
ncbi:TetR/AcrR family transcriptional regulator [Actinopolymorpha pittospori]